MNLLIFHCSNITRSPVEKRLLFIAGISTSKRRIFCRYAAWISPALWPAVRR